MPVPVLRDGWWLIALVLDLDHPPAVYQGRLGVELAAVTRTPQRLQQRDAVEHQRRRQADGAQSSALAGSIHSGGQRADEVRPVGDQFRTDRVRRPSSP